MQESLIMTMKINSYTLPKETKKEMIDAIGKSIRSKSEHGFNLCLDKDNNIRPGKVCKGRKCYIETAEFECKENEKHVGVFHTHLKTLNPSVSDLAIGYSHDMNCIGNYEGIRCFKRKREDFDALEYADIRLSENREHFMKLELDRLETKEITYKEYKEELEKYRKEIDGLVNSYFKVINITK
jgi:hypothetical protein